MKKFQQGFTLIELIIVVAILSILAAIAFQYYQDHAIHKRVTESLGASEAAKTVVAGNAASGAADFSTGFTAPAATADLASETISPAGVIIITTTAQAGAVTITLTPFDGNIAGGALAISTTPKNPIAWACSVSPASAFKYVPPSCRQATAAAIL